jgi:hypothetical protein
MPTIDDLFPSKFMKVLDLGGKAEVVVIIRDCNVEVLETTDGRKNTKMVLYFEPPYGQKGLPLNKTNFESVAKVTGEPNADNWVGHKLCLYPAQAAMGKTIYDVIRIKAPPKGKAKVKATADDSPPDDGVPFNDDAPDFADDEAA